MLTSECKNINTNTPQMQIQSQIVQNNTTIVRTAPLYTLRVQLSTTSTNLILMQLPAQIQLVKVQAQVLLNTSKY